MGDAVHYSINNKNQAFDQFCSTVQSFFVGQRNIIVGLLKLPGLRGANNRINKMCPLSTPFELE